MHVESEALVKKDGIPPREQGSEHFPVALPGM